jgi:hypothetical protein
MTTAQDIVNGAIKKIGVLRKNEAPSADECVDALNVLNDMLASWSNDSLLCYATVTDAAMPIGPAASYTIGPSQVLNTVRPMWIKAANVTVGGLDFALTIVPEDDFQLQIVQKNIGSNIPLYLTYNNAYPYGLIKLWPQASTNITLTLMSEKLIASFASLTSTFDMPPGWSHALKTNLGINLLRDYNLPPDPLLLQLANEAKGALKKQTIKAHPITFGDNLPRRYSILTGTEV